MDSGKFNLLIERQDRINATLSKLTSQEINQVAMKFKTETLRIEKGLLTYILILNYELNLNFYNKYRMYIYAVFVSC